MVTHCSHSMLTSKTYISQTMNVSCSCVMYQTMNVSCSCVMYQTMNVSCNCVMYQTMNVSCSCVMYQTMNVSCSCVMYQTFNLYRYMSRSTKENDIVDSAWSIDPDQPKHAAQANPDRHFSPPVDFLFQESLLYTSIPLIQNVSARINLCRLCMLIRVDIVHTVGFLVERLIYVIYVYNYTLSLTLFHCYGNLTKSTFLNVSYVFNIIDHNYFDEIKDIDLIYASMFVIRFWAFVRFFLVNTI